MICRHCNFEELLKNWKNNRGEQRYQAIVLYTEGNGFRRIARILALSERLCKFTNLHSLSDKAEKYPTIYDIWKCNWQGIIPFLAFPSYIRRAIYTTNTIESINRQIRKIIKSKGCFLNDEAVFKLVFLALQNVQKKWTMPIREWKLALNQFSILFDQFTQF